MKRGEGLKPGAKSLERGSTFARAGSNLRPAGQKSRVQSEDARVSSAGLDSRRRSKPSGQGFANVVSAADGQNKVRHNSLKRTQPRRFWDNARAKVEREACCRCPAGYGACEGKLEAAHIVGREMDRHPLPGDHTGLIIGKLIVEPVRVVPLCAKHHRMYDAHELDLLAALTTEEQVQAVADCGSIEVAWQRTAPVAYRRLMNGGG